jgi:uncharacterized protein RhaS with RHS repeats
VGAREYDPHTAWWLQRDPIDAASGDPNLYRYCGNDPVNQVDPDGTEVEWRDLLDVAGFIPGIGEVADLVNAGLSRWKATGETQRFRWRGSCQAVMRSRQDG